MLLKCKEIQSALQKQICFCVLICAKLNAGESVGELPSLFASFVSCFSIVSLFNNFQSPGFISLFSFSTFFSFLLHFLSFLSSPFLSFYPSLYTLLLFFLFLFSPSSILLSLWLLLSVSKVSAQARGLVHYNRMVVLQDRVLAVVPVRCSTCVGNS